MDGERPRTAVLDTTRENADGYDIAHLGTLPLTGGLDTTIELSDDADGFVIADAIRLRRRP